VNVYWQPFIFYLFLFFVSCWFCFKQIRITLPGDKIHQLLAKLIRFYSGVVAGAREALICGVPSLSISLNWLVEVFPFFLFALLLVFK